MKKYQQRNKVINYKRNFLNKHFKKAKFIKYKITCDIFLIFGVIKKNLYISALIIVLILISKNILVKNFYKNIYNNKKVIEIIEIPKKENIYKEYKFDSLYKSFVKAKDFLNQCLAGNLINNKTIFKSNEEPLISVVIPIYNCQNFITRTIRSVQNQNLLNIEIILIDDFTTDNTLSLLKAFNKDDPRIKIIRNKKNVGILYSGSIGVLSANGKYIFPLDNDDMILDKDVLSTILNISKEGNFDIVEFKGVERDGEINLLNYRIRGTSFADHKLNLVLFQPELSDFFMKTGSKITDRVFLSHFTWCKLIKTNIYTKALNSLGEERYSRYMLANEDLAIMITLLSTANSYKFVGKYGLYHIRRERSSYYLTDEIQMSVRELYIADIAIDFFNKTNEHKKLIPHLIYKFLNVNNLETVLNSNKYYKQLLYSCLDRVLKSDFYSKEFINEIINKGKTLKFIDYPNFK